MPHGKQNNVGMIVHLQNLMLRNVCKGNLLAVTSKGFK